MTEDKDYDSITYRGIKIQSVDREIPLKAQETAVENAKTLVDSLTDHEDVEEETVKEINSIWTYTSGAITVQTKTRIPYYKTDSNWVLKSSSSTAVRIKPRQS